MLNFNSIKVQLKLFDKNASSNPYEFQFHKGTIKTKKALQNLRDLHENFNSIKVQLKQSTKTSIINAP